MYLTLENAAVSKWFSTDVHSCQISSLWLPAIKSQSIGRVKFTSASQVTTA